MLGENHPEVVAEGLALTVQCANPDCREKLFQFHGIGVVKAISPCPKCGRRTMVKSDWTSGVTVLLLPKEKGDRIGKGPLRSVGTGSSNSD